MWVIEPGELQRHLEAMPWTFAKTMPTIPHCHCHVSKVTPAVIETAARGIALLGEPMRWRQSKPRLYFTAGGFMYWFMDQHWSEVTLINRQTTDPEHVAQMTRLA